MTDKSPNGQRPFTLTKVLWLACFSDCEALPPPCKTVFSRARSAACRIFKLLRRAHVPQKSSRRRLNGRRGLFPHRRLLLTGEHCLKAILQKAARLRKSLRRHSRGERPFLRLAVACWRTLLENSLAEGGAIAEASPTAFARPKCRSVCPTVAYWRTLSGNSLVKRGRLWQQCRVRLPPFSLYGRIVAVANVPKQIERAFLRGKRAGILPGAEESLIGSPRGSNAV